MLSKRVPVKLQVFSSNAAKGLADLVDRASDIAMVSVPMDVTVDAAAEAGKKMNAKDFQFFELKKDEIVFVVNQANPVDKLNREWLRSNPSVRCSESRVVSRRQGFRAEQEAGQPGSNLECGTKKSRFS